MDIYNDGIHNNDIHRDRLDTDVVIVGGGPAGLACAIHLAQLIKAHNQNARHPLNEDGIIVLEKATLPGQHSLSGAIMDPIALNELLPEKDLNGLKMTSVKHESLFYLTQKKAFKLPSTLGFMHNKSLSIISLGDLVHYLGEVAESLGASIVSGTTVRKLLIENEQVSGVQTEDKGLDAQYQRKANFEPGLRIKAPVSVLAEGSYGTLSQSLIRHFNLDKDCTAQTYGLGFKERWQIPQGLIEPGTVWHSFGYPLNTPDSGSGGGWLYAISENQISIGQIVDLDYNSAAFDPFIAFQQFKSHPVIKRILKAGKRLSYGARTLPKGGYWSRPQPYTQGALLLGDSAGLVDTRRLKGIHLAIKSGMLAAETIFSAQLQNNYSSSVLKQYDEKIKQSFIGQSLWRARNHQQALSKGGVSGYADLLIQQFTHGRGLYKKNTFQSAMHKKPPQPGPLPEQQPEQLLSNSKENTELKSDSLFFSSIHNTANQAPHITITDPDICAVRCAKEYANPCQHFCPAQVYEISINNTKAGVKLNTENCLHCKTCEILDPYHIVKWQPPEGGDGPRFKGM